MRDVPWFLFAVFLALSVGIVSFEIASAVMGDALAIALGGLMFAAVMLMVDKRAKKASAAPAQRRQASRRRSGAKR